MKRRAVIGVAAGIVAVAAAAGAVAAWMVTRPESAEDAAGRYLAALADGDVAAVERFLPDASDTEHLSAAFAGATGYIEDYDYTVGEVRDGAQRVEANVRLGGERRTLGFVLARADDGWELDVDELGSLEVSTTLGDAVRVGDAVTALSVRLLPAVYPVEPMPVGILAGGSEVAVTSPDSVALSLEPTLTPEATALAQRQLDAYAAGCAEATDAVPDDCGLRVPWAADLARLDAIAFRIEAPPVVALAPDGQSFAATGGVIAATASGVGRDGGAASFTYRADDWALRGTVEFASDAMALVVD
ncbi:hypothetical protein [Microbacterium sp. SLBN-146]|uniref:hypothetical protein n=1 Tax=Microbacterium sp. SLBN-146 TaxID=2768457 RepID=UPI001151EFA1|nr:hypothetical protein [Microbacterium sp. SLBN-146]TQJ31674.1 hypothetical protein FBY39_2155 [Microbacterium sp. SLBN-146]